MPSSSRSASWADLKPSYPNSQSSSRSPSSGDLVGTSSNQSSRRHNVTRTVYRGFFRFLKDLTTFLVRGGITSMMFFMDEVVSLVLASVSWLPGAVYVEYLIRPLVWVFQLLMWIVYTGLELLLYLPTAVLVVYVGVIGVLYFYYAPRFVNDLIKSMYWVAHNFLVMIKRMLY